MSTVNTEYIMPQNQRIARLVNDIGEILLREDSKLYNDVILLNFDFNKKLETTEEKDFLNKLYNCMIDKLKELKIEEE